MSDTKKSRKPSGKRKKVASSDPVRVPIWIDRIAGGRPRLRTALRWTLLLSLVLHLSVAPLIPNASKISADAERYESEYMRKVEAAKVSRIVASQIKDKITMPPPPPDPEAHIAETLSNELTSDIKKVVSEVAEVDLSKKLAGHVAKVFEDEWKEAAKQIAQGKLSEKEIKELQDKYRKQVHAETMKALQSHRVETQVERATLTATEWYEKKVASTVFRNMMYVLKSRKHYRGIWDSMYAGVYTGWGRGLNFNDIRSDGMLSGKIGGLHKLIKAHAKTEPSEEDAGKFVGGLKRLFKGHISSRGTYPSPSWKCVIYGGQDRHVIGTRTHVTHMSSGIINEFHPHKVDAVTPIAKELDELWKQTLAAGDEYLNQAREGATADELKDPKEKCMKGIKEICGKAGKLRVGDRGRAPNSFRVINSLVRSEVLRSPLRDEVYKNWVDTLTKELRPLIRKFAKSQFKKGIIVHKKSVEEALKDFTEDIVPLLRRDLRKMLPQKTFNVWLFGGSYPFRSYKSAVTGDVYSCPRPEDAKKDDALLASILSKHPDRKAYADKRREHLQKNMRDAVDLVRETLMSKVFSSNLLFKQMGTFVEGADYADKVKERLDARAHAMNGRGQDYAKLTGGVPDTSAAMFSLEFGGPKGNGASLEPVMAALAPGYITRSLSARAFRSSNHAFPPAPAKWGFDAAQATVKPKFKSPRFESIPFLTKFPKLDGDLSDWGRIRPLVLRAGKGQKPILFYAAWNYLGFFFAYDVKLPMERFYYSEYDRRRGGDPFRGDYLRLLFDTLDARNANRGEPHTQEFVILPRGTHVDPDLPGVEVVISSQRDAKKKDWRGVKTTTKAFPAQPPASNGPDGEGPYRVTRIRNQGDLNQQGYTVEVFIPRKLFNTPVFAPGWYIGFDCEVAMGYQGKRGGKKQLWANSRTNNTMPRSWGDLLMLGTDARVVVQQADSKGSLAYGIVPGHSYLLTVIDPDRNVSLAQKDTVLVSAEVKGGYQDTEVFILKETTNNSGIFRGYINTQPGMGREVQGVLELLAGQEVRLGYVDFSNSKGVRNVVAQVRLPVISGMMQFSRSEK